MLYMNLKLISDKKEVFLRIESMTLLVALCKPVASFNRKFPKGKSTWNIKNLMKAKTDTKLKFF